MVLPNPQAGLGEQLRGEGKKRRKKDGKERRGEERENEDEKGGSGALPSPRFQATSLFSFICQSIRKGLFPRAGIYVRGSNPGVRVRDVFAHREMSSIIQNT
jgi:hypothetical protein